MSHFVVRRRQFIGLLSGLAVSGCASFTKSSPFWGTIAAGVGGGDVGAPAISREYTDKLPYASMLAWFDGSPKALLVLSRALPDGRYIWHSADRKAITGFGPYVVSAIGFDRELRSTAYEGVWDRNPSNMVGRRVARTLDMSIDGERHQLRLESNFVRGDVEQVDVFGRDYRLQKVVERVSHDGRKRFENDYWVEPTTGRCWKSQQTIVPTVPPFNIEILKYPSK